MKRKIIKIENWWTILLLCFLSSCTNGKPQDITKTIMIVLFVLFIILMIVQIIKGDWEDNPSAGIFSIICLVAVLLILA